MNTIIIRFREVYGKELIYIVSDNAGLFNSLTGRKTIDRNDILILLKLGFSVQGYGADEQRLINQLLMIN